MNILNELKSRCKFGMSIEIDNHKVYHDTVEEHLDSFFGVAVNSEEYKTDFKDYDKMIELNTIVEIQCYPVSSVGSITVLHYDLDIALEIALKLVVGYGERVD